MNYSSIINRAFDIAWRYKSLWIFGVFAGGPGNFNLPTNLGTDGSSDNPFGMDFTNLPQWFDSIGPALLTAVVGFILGFIVVMMIASIISQSALVDSVNRIDRGGIYRFGTAFSVGIDYFWRVFGMTILLVLAAIIAIVGLVGIGVVSFIGHIVLGILMLLVLIPLALVIIWVVGTVFSLGLRVMVVRDCSIGDALEEGWILLKRYPGPTVIIILINLGFAIAFGMGLLIAWAIVGVPFGLMAAAMGASTLGAIIIGIVAGLPISIVVGGFSGTFASALYTLFYFELVEPRPETSPAYAPPQPPVMPA